MGLNNTILFVIPWLPYPFTSGGRQAVFNGIRAVSGHADIIVTYCDDGSCQSADDLEAFRKLLGGNVTVTPFLKQIPSAESERDKKDVLAILRLYRSIKALKRIVKKGVKNLFGIKEKATPKTGVDKPYLFWYKQFLPIDQGFGCHIRHLIDLYDVDIVQCEMFRCAPAVYYLPQSVKKVFVHHELRAERYCLERDAEGNHSLEQDVYLDYFRANEIALLNQFDSVITLSDVDKNKLIHDGVKAKIYASMAIVNTSPDLAELSTTEKYRLTFIGNDAHYPNVDGILWFLDVCWGTLMNISDSFHLDIIGKWSRKFVEEVTANYMNVSFLGYVDDLSSCIRNTIMIVPIRIGSGIRMKILEAGSAGAPVVSTSVGVEGLPLKDGEDIFIADTPEQFVSSILKLQDDDIFLKFVRSANQVVKNRYSFTAFQNDRLMIYNSICK